MFWSEIVLIISVCKADNCHLIYDTENGNRERKGGFLVSSKKQRSCRDQASASSAEHLKSAEGLGSGAECQRNFRLSGSRDKWLDGQATSCGAAAGICCRNTKGALTCDLGLGCKGGPPNSGGCYM